MFSKLNVVEQRSKSEPFEELKVETLARLDEGFDSLKFLQRIGKAHMVESDYSAFMQVCGDFVWAKTAVERAFRLYPRTSVFNRDKKLLRGVLVDLFQYVIKSVTRLLTKDCMKCPKNAAAELSGVLNLLLLGAQRIAYHECLLASPFAVVKVRLHLAVRPKQADADFAMIAKTIENELELRKNIYSA